MPLPKDVIAISFDALGKRVGLITEGAHAGLAAAAGQYKHPDLGTVFVKQETDLPKNLIEWSFYQLAKAVLANSGQQDILDRMAPTILVTPEAKDNSLSNVYVGSVAHNKMELAWKDVYAANHANEPIPARRPGGFEHLNQEAIQDYIKKFNKQDPGFSMLPVLAVLGHHAVHLGNLGYQQEESKKKLVFFDYGAATWYNLQNKQLAEPEIRGNVKDFFAKQLLGVSKNYLDYYTAAMDAPAINQRMNNFSQQFEQNLDIIMASFRISIHEMSQILDNKSFQQFAEYVGIPPVTIKNSSSEDLSKVIADQIVLSMANRVNMIPDYLKESFPEKTANSTSKMFAEMQHKPSASDAAFAQLKQIKLSKNNNKLAEAPTTSVVKIDSSKLKNNVQQSYSEENKLPIKNKIK